MLEIEGLTKSWPGFRLDLALSVGKGEIAAILGPSGGGKSTLLRLIAGLESPDSGRIAIGGIDLTLAPPERRGIGMVFQDFALFPHMSVRKNIEYGPKMQGASRSERRRSAEAIAASFEIGPLLDRSPYSLSGGEQQRVALARALAARPGIVLLDEPLSSLDASLRRRLRVEIAKRLKEAGVTAVLVTHDAEEALAVADRIFLMRAGSVNAEGRPEDLYVSPPTAWIASFLGRGPVLEILSLSGDECNPVATTSIGAFRCAPRRGSESRKSPISLFFPASAPRIVSGHRLHPGDSDAGIERNLIRGRIASIFFAGHCRRLTLSCPVVEGSGRGGELELELELNSSLKPSIGEFLELEIAPNSCVILRDSTT